MSTLAVTIGGIPFRPVDERTMDRLSAYMPPDDLPDVMTPRSDWPGPNLDRLGLPTLPPPGQKVGLGCLWYPWGMSRFAIYRGIMTAANVDSLGALVTAAPTTAKTFNMYVDGAGVSTPLYVLPPRPIVSPPGTSSQAVPQLYLVTLVDDRFFKQGAGGGTIRINSTDNATWASLITALATALDITLTSASVDAAYFRPEPDSFLYSNQESAAALLDAVAANVGRVVVRNLDGTYKLQTYSDANAAETNGRYQNDSTSQPFRARLWGGAILPTTAGNSTWRPMTVPASVLVTFPKWITAAGYYEPTNYRQYAKDSYGDVYEKTVTLADLGSPYSTWTAGPGKKVIRVAAKAEFAIVGAGSPSNITDLTTLAQRVAQDFYNAAAASLDECYSGIVSYTPNGTCDTLWCVRGVESGEFPTVYTRVTRRPFEYGASHRQNGITALTIPGGETCTGTVYEVTRYRSDCIDGILYSVTWTETGTYDAEGCLEVTEGEETSNPIGCCDCNPVPVPEVECCTGVELPTTLTGTIQARTLANPAVACGCDPNVNPYAADGTTFTLTWNADYSQYQGTYTACDAVTVYVCLTCIGTDPDADWCINGFLGGFNLPPYSFTLNCNPTFDCEPFYLETTITSGDLPCQLTFIIEE